MRAIFHGYRVKLQPRPLALIRVRPASLSGDREGMDAEGRARTGRRRRAARALAGGACVRRTAEAGVPTSGARPPGDAALGGPPLSGGGDLLPCGGGSRAERAPAGCGRHGQCRLPQRHRTTGAAAPTEDRRQAGRRRGSAWKGSGLQAARRRRAALTSMRARRGDASVRASCSCVREIAFGARLQQRYANGLECPCSSHLGGHTRPGRRTSAPQAIEHGHRLGVDLSSHQPREFGSLDLRDADVVLALRTESHRDGRRARRMGVASEPFTLPELVDLLDVSAASPREVIAAEDATRRKGRWAGSPRRGTRDPLGRGKLGLPDRGRRDRRSRDETPYASCLADTTGSPWPPPSRPRRSRAFGDCGVWAC